MFNLKSTGARPPLKTRVRVRVRDNSTTLNNSRDNADTRQSRRLLVSREGVCRVKVLVDDTGHAVLAVIPTGLGTVVPDGVLVLDDDLEDVGSLAASYGLEAAEEGLEPGGVGGAGLGEGGLGDGVVPGEEVPLYDVARLGDDVAWVEDEGASSAGDHGVGHSCQGHGVGGGVCCCGGGSRRDEGHGGQGSDESVGEHVICLDVWTSFGKEFIR